MNTKNNSVFDEINIKTYLIDYLRNKKKDAIIGVEVPYLLGDRRVDVLQLYNDNLYAYEIKSDKDNLSKLHEQIEECSSTFDFVSVIITPKHDLFIKNKRIEFQNKIGIILFDNLDFIEIKKPMANRLKKEKLSYFLNRAALSKVSKNSNKFRELSELRNSVSQTCSTKRIKQRAYSVLINKYSARYNAFLSSVGSCTLPEDLKILSSSLTF